MNAAFAFGPRAGLGELAFAEGEVGERLGGRRRALLGARAQALGENRVDPALDREESDADSKHEGDNDRTRTSGTDLHSNRWRAVHGLRGPIGPSRREA